MNRLHMPTKN